ncbi:MAG TPA: PQQ-binding-like beta-propeller repeat protein [Candidatus Acidoferrales bacterium]|nr:PQQ-binding-like beta-propeller repeat protein [Candidatus Acidoferrales bacterium]
MRYLCLLALAASFALPAHAQEGATVYKQHCASCHDAPQGRVPPASALRTMSIDQILSTLERGPMKTIGDTLNPDERKAVSSYLGNPAAKAASIPSSGACPANTKAPKSFSSGVSWTSWSPDATNTRFQKAHAAGLTAADIPKLKLKWAFSFGDETEARTPPTVVDGRLFFGTGGGTVYSLDASTGCIHWSTKIDGGVRSPVTVGKTGHGNQEAIYFGSGANAYALDAGTGTLLWKVPVDDYFAAMITAAPLLHDGVLYVPISSFEEVLPPQPTYQCCGFRGSVVALNAATGKQIWKTYTITQSPQPTEKNKAGAQMRGPSGAAVWSTPTFDDKLNAIYIATGDNYSKPTTNTSDAVMALDAGTGQILWTRQVTPGDAYNNACGIPGSPNCPEPAGHDFDFGQPPILVSLSSDRRELVIAQKSSDVYALNPDKKGELLWQKHLGQGGALGGSEWGSAADGQNIYVALSDLKFKGIVADKSSKQGYRLLLNPTKGGGLFALRLTDGQTAWSAKPVLTCGDTPECSPAQSQAVTVIPGVVFSGSLDGHLRAYSASTGEILWDIDTARDYTTVTGALAHGGSLDAAGPVIAGGMLFVTSGYAQFGGAPGNALLAFSVDGK